VGPEESSVPTCWVELDGSRGEDETDRGMRPKLSNSDIAAAGTPRIALKRTELSVRILQQSLIGRSW
jgi:hypothetical protein